MTSQFIRITTVGALFAGLPFQSSADAQEEAPIVTVADQQIKWSQGKLGAGGFVSGMDLHPSGELKLVRTDVGGAYKWDAERGEWIQLATTERLPEGALGFFEYDGVSSLVSAPSDIDRLYMAFCGNIYHSRDRGETWQAPQSLPGAPISMDPNARVGRLQGERLAVDPQNPDFVFYGSNRSGLLLSRDGGKNWEQIPLDAVPQGTEATSQQNRRALFYPGVGNVLFDPSSPVLDGKTSRIYATVWGVGLFRSDDAGTSWTQLGKDLELTSIESASIAKDGTLVLAQQAGRNAFIIRDGELARLAIPREQPWNEAVIDPRNSERILLFGPGVMGFDRQARSLDGGATWTQIGHGELIAEDIPWLAKEAFFSTGAIRFDPVKEDRIWIAQGVGVWFSDNALSDTRIRWQSQSAGIEELVVNEILVPEPGQPVVACWDRAVFKIEDINKYPETWGPVEEFSSGWDMDFMFSNPRSMVGIFQGQANNPHAGVMMSGWSDDGGRTWTPFAFEKFPFDVKDPHVWVYGNIAVSSQDPNKIIWFTVGQEGRFLYTHDRGRTWQDAEFEGGVPPGSWNRASYFYKDVITADAVDGNTFYAYNWTTRKIYRSQDGGRTFQIMGEIPCKRGHFHAKLRAHPKRSGNLFFTSGFNNHNLGDADMGTLWESRDAGATWTQVPGTEKIIDIAFGAPKPGSDVLTYYVNGAMTGPEGTLWGIFRSLDEGQTWAKISGIYPMGVSKGQSVLAADPGIYGRIYSGSSGIGFFYSDLP
jgi:photosystem II stability/assembly factor-like uncharacterized protein